MRSHFSSCCNWRILLITTTLEKEDRGCQRLSSLSNQTTAYRQLQMSFMCSVMSWGRCTRCEEQLKISKPRLKRNTEAGLDKTQDLLPHLLYNHFVKDHPLDFHWIFATAMVTQICVCVHLQYTVWSLKLNKEVLYVCMYSHIYQWINK